MFFADDSNADKFNDRYHFTRYFSKNASAIIAIYGVGSQIIQYFKTIGGHFNGVLMAGVVRMVENGAKVKDLQNEMVRIGRIILMMLGMILLCLSLSVNIL